MEENKLTCPCGEPVKHGFEHPGECCDCFDLGWFPEKINQINNERFRKGKPALKERWKLA
jgi:hypothetical protein